MAFDEAVAGRLRDALAEQKGIAEKKMFGGIAFLLDGNMCVGVHGDELIVRLPPDETDEALRDSHVRRFDLTGRPMKGWVLVAPAGVATDADLRAWVDRSVAFARSLPAKKS